MDIRKTKVDLPPVRRMGTKHTNDKLAFVLDNVLTEDECKALIEETEEKGYEAALLNVGNGRQVLDTTNRNSKR